MDSIDVDNIGNVTLKCNNDLAEEYYLIILTTLGETCTYQFGPLNADFNTPGPYFSFNKQTFEYSERAINKMIDKFINREGITQVMEIDMHDAIDRLDGVIETWQESR